MSNLRQTYKVSWDDGEPVTVMTTVRDLMETVDSIPETRSRNKIALETTLIHIALQRNGVDVPDYDKFVEVLDHYELINERLTVEGPTNPVVSATGQSLLPSLPEPIGNNGSGKIPARSKPQKKSLSKPDG